MKRVRTFIARKILIPILHVVYPIDMMMEDVVEENKKMFAKLRFLEQARRRAQDLPKNDFQN